MEKISLIDYKNVIKTNNVASSSITRDIYINLLTERSLPRKEYVKVLGIEKARAL